MVRVRRGDGLAVGAGKGKEGQSLCAWPSLYSPHPHGLDSVCGVPAAAAEPTPTNSFTTGVPIPVDTL